jgi:ABC-2 type transport system permease protein
MSWRAIRAIAGRDLRLVVRSRAVLVPMIIVPVMFFVLMPALVVGGLRLAGDLPDDVTDLLQMLPGPVADELAGLTEVQQVLIWTTNYLFAPFFLIVPLMVASVVAADSFAGERERGTIEALLYAPISDGELYFAKLLGPFAAAVGVGFLGFVAYVVTVDVLAYEVMGRLILPNLTWILLALWVSPAVAGLGIGAMVLVSSKVRGFQEAWQLGGVIVLPFVLLIVAQLAGAIYFSPFVVIVLGAVLLLVDLALLRAGAILFRREEMVLRA